MPIKNSNLFDCFFFHHLYKSLTLLKQILTILITMTLQIEKVLFFFYYNPENCPLQSQKSPKIFKITFYEIEHLI